jgi:hypothetical protein
VLELGMWSNASVVGLVLVDGGGGWRGKLLVYHCFISTETAKFSWLRMWNTCVLQLLQLRLRCSVSSGRDCSKG